MRREGEIGGERHRIEGIDEIGRGEWHDVLNTQVTPTFPWLPRDEGLFDRWR